MILYRKKYQNCLGSKKGINLLQRGFVQDTVKKEPKLTRKKKEWSCEECELNGKQQVKGEGNIATATVIVVGDAPGRNEEKLGQPFVGQSGQLLRTMLFESGAGFTDVYLTNVVKCRLDGGVKFSKQMVNCCKRLLDEELTLAKNKKLIIACGDMAASGLGINCSITEDRGKFFDTSYGKVMLTSHPVYMLRAGEVEYHGKSLLEFMVDDIKRAKIFVETGRWFKDIKDKIKVIRTVEDIQAMQAAFQNFTGKVGLDFETNMLDMYHKEFKVVSLSLSKGVEEAWWINLRSLDKEIIEKALKAAKDIYWQGNVVMHGSEFDLQVANYLGWGLKEVDDTLHVLYLLEGGNRVGGKKLKRLALDYTDYGDYGVDIGNINSLSDEELMQYNCADALVTVELFDKFWARMTDNLKYAYKTVLTPARVLLITASVNGMKIDVPYAIELSKELKTRIEDYKNRANIEVGYEINLGSPKQILNFLKSKGLNISSTGEEVLELYKSDSFVQLILDYRRAKKLLSTYVEPYIVDHTKEGNLVHGKFSLVTAATGRVAGTDPNLMNIPVKNGNMIEKMFISRFENGYILKADYSQQELRIAAVYGKDKKMEEFFKSGKDMHRMTAVEIYGTPEAWFESSDKNELKKAEEARQVAKGFNFGVIYGRGSVSIARELDIEIEDAEQFRAKYFNLFSGLAQWLEDTRKFALQNGFVQSMFGRIRYLDVNNPDQGLRGEALRQAVNTPVQGAASDVALLGGKLILDEIQKRGLKTKFINFVHDALLYDIPVDELEQVIGIIKEKAVAVSLPIKTEVPLGIDIQWGKSWGELE